MVTCDVCSDDFSDGEPMIELDGAPICSWACVLFRAQEQVDHCPTHADLAAAERSFLQRLERIIGGGGL